MSIVVSLENIWYISIPKPYPLLPPPFLHLPLAADNCDSIRNKISMEQSLLHGE